MDQSPSDAERIFGRRGRGLWTCERGEPGAAAVSSGPWLSRFFSGHSRSAGPARPAGPAGLARLWLWRALVMARAMAPTPDQGYPQ